MSSDVQRLYFAADFHLDGGEVARDRLVLLLRRAQREGAALYLLGDVFHYWFGPRHLRLPMYQREFDLLAGITGLGVPVTIVPGNRDFLLDDEFTARTGVAVSPDELELTWGGTKLHLSHGDLFGLADHRYQRMRKVLHSGAVHRLARSLPTFLIHMIARRLRRHSEKVVAEKSAETLAPDRGAIAEEMKAGTDVVICGHFHHAVNEAFPAEEGGGTFRVLEPYEEEGYVLEFSADGWTEHRLDPSPVAVAAH